jgi:hypothetical protein
MYKLFVDIVAAEIETLIVFAYTGVYLCQSSLEHLS